MTTPRGASFHFDPDWDAMALWCRRARHVTNAFWAHYATYSLGEIARRQGNDQEAWTQVRELHPEGPATEPGNCSFLAGAGLQIVAAQLSLEAQDLEQAERWLIAHDRWMEWSGAVLGLSEGQLAWASYHRARGDLDFARQHAERAFELAFDPRQPLALVATGRFLGQLNVDEERWDEAEARLIASLELAAQCEAPFEQALTLVVMAERAVKLDNVDEARGLIRRVREICGPLGAKPTLERVDEIEASLPRTRRSTGEHPFGLTDREVEVLKLVAQGMTDAEAAEELFISPRTASQHMRSVYNKLAANNRAEATRIAVEQGIV